MMNKPQALNDSLTGIKGLVFNEPLLFEMGSPGRTAYSLPKCDVPEAVSYTHLTLPTKA